MSLLVASTDSLPAWLVLILGCGLLAGLYMDRHNIQTAWRKPARFWRPSEYGESRMPSQPLNLVLGVALGAAAVVYGVVSLFL